MTAEQLERVYEIAERYKIDVSDIVVRKCGKVVRAYCDLDSRVTKVGGVFRHCFKITENGEVFDKKLKRI